MSTFNMSDHPHRRYNPLSREWILVSPHRTKRPWLGQVEKTPLEKRPSYDPTCYLCPGNTRTSGVQNPQYTKTYVFDNDFMALLPDVPSGELNDGDLFIAKSERGLCRVICYNPDHSLTMAEMSTDAIQHVIDLWAAQYKELGSLNFINYVQIFENKGAIMGCSNPHPHGQIWANENLPQEPAAEQASQLAYLHEKGHCLLCDYAKLELEKRERIICQNDAFLAVVPFWAIWPFEALVLPKRHVTCLSELTAKEKEALADILKQLTVRYDNLFEVSFPYTMGIHQKPTDGQAHDEWHLHWHFYPPLLRSATVKKFMVGYEMLANAQRDITAESAAERLRSLPNKRFA